MFESLITRNPTRTLMLERSYIGQLNKRFKKLARELIAYIETPSLVRLSNSALEEFDADRMRVLMAWLVMRIEELISNDWVNHYTLESYRRTLKRTRRDLLRQGESVELTQADFDTAETINFDEEPSLLVGTVEEVHSEELEFLYTRHLSKINGIGEQYASALMETLMDARRTGKGMREVRKEVAQVTKTNLNKAEAIARTEIINASHRANINQLEVVNERFAPEQAEDEFVLVWITAYDERVRKLHARWHGTANSAERTREMIKISPWRCRCGQRLIRRKRLTVERKRKWREERRGLIQLLG